MAAGSVVVKDVPPYAIAGGNPARIIRYRFPEDVIEKLRRIAWWDYSSEQLNSRREDMLGEVADFADKYDVTLSLYPRKSGEYVPRLSENVPLFVYFMDFTDEYSVFTGNLLTAFIKRYLDMSAELLLCYDAESEEETARMESVARILSGSGEITALINICGITRADEEKVISEADALITNRHARTLERIAIADRYGVDILSGVDIPLFDPA